MEVMLTSFENFKLLLLPNEMLSKCGIYNRVTASVTKNGVLLSPSNNIRRGWEDAIKANPPQKNIQEIDDLVCSSSFDGTEWTWPES